MPVYNYFWARWSDGDAAVEDAPPAIVGAVEEWLEASAPPEPSLVTVGRVPAHRLALLVLRFSREGGRARPAPDLTHVIAIPDRRLADPSAPALRGVFEQLYGRPLHASLTALAETCARRTRAEGAAHVLGRFADESQLRSLPWARFEESGETAPAPHSGGREGPPAPGDRRRRRDRGAGRLAAFAAGAGTAVLVAVPVGIGLLAQPSPILRGLRAGPQSAGAESAERLRELEQQVQTLLTALRERDVAHRRELERIESGHAAELASQHEELSALAALLARADGEVEGSGVSAVDRSVEPAIAPAPEPSPQPAAETPAPLPAVAAPPRDAPSAPGFAPRAFRVTADTARVRAGPSGDDPTRGLVGLRTPVTVIGERGDWLEIEPPPGTAAPTWIHRSLVESAD